MDIQELRHSVRMTQKQFSLEFGIPIGTLRNWEQKISNPPEYVFTMIFSTIRRDIMINVETIKLISFMKELAEESKNGICEFAEANENNFRTKVFYDKNTKDETGGYRVVCDACLVDDPYCYHHDVISYCDQLSPEFTIRARKTEEDDDFFLDVRLIRSDVSFVIENGDWYCSNYDF